jgi:hypothetical protein
MPNADEPVTPSAEQGPRDPQPDIDAGLRRYYPEAEAQTPDAFPDPEAGV